MPPTHPLQNRFHVNPFPKRNPMAVYKHKVSNGVEGASMPSEDEVLESFKEHLQLALMIELSTIPLYLYPYYSVGDSSDPAAVTIRDIVIQEMVHLALVGNIIRSVGGKPLLYHSKSFPRYPMLMVDRHPGLVLHLMPLTWPMIGIAREVEKRSEVGPLPDEGADGLPDEYGSLGEFYKELQSFVIDHLKDDNFQKSLITDQISNNDGYKGKDLITISGVEDALHAMNIIIEEGEGGGGETGDSHIEKFEKMQEPKSVLPVPPEDPHTSDYYRKPSVVAVSNLFNACFCYLLLTIETMWVTPQQPQRGKLGTNIHTVMHDILKVLAPWLCRQKIYKEHNAAPTFEFWDFTADGGTIESALKQVVQMKDDLPPEIHQDADLISALNAVDNLNPLFAPDDC